MIATGLHGLRSKSVQALEEVSKGQIVPSMIWAKSLQDRAPQVRPLHILHIRGRMQKSCRSSCVSGATQRDMTHIMETCHDHSRLCPDDVTMPLAV